MALDDGKAGWDEGFEGAWMEYSGEGDYGACHASTNLDLEFSLNVLSTVETQEFYFLISSPIGLQIATTPLVLDGDNDRRPLFTN
jgi:hypothetical protein